VSWFISHIINEDDIIHIRRGALLHDIGKLGIPDNILLKPGPLTDEEWVVMKRHPVYAYEWLNRLNICKKLSISHITTTKNGKE
jgi:HD-GYP domain-containing protein (c-di-GMP phosphodiesterase class II)